ncbi:MAG TPA: hypothetical protein VK678_20510, partial [Bradyrhizobium sp.]|nr:hypothetical protein [Bradyrhizobium sp.]
MSATLAWKLNRLKGMGPAEVCWRLRQGIATGVERMGFGLARDVKAGAGAAGPAWVSPLPTNFDAMPYIEAANRLVAGRWDLFSLRDSPLG